MHWVHTTGNMVKPFIWKRVFETKGSRVHRASQPCQMPLWTVKVANKYFWRLSKSKYSTWNMTMKVGLNPDLAVTFQRKLSSTRSKVLSWSGPGCQCPMSWRSLQHPELGRCGPALYKVSLLNRHYILSFSISCDCSLTQGTPKVFPITPPSAFPPLPYNSPDPFE